MTKEAHQPELRRRIRCAGTNMPHEHESAKRPAKRSAILSMGHDRQSHCPGTRLMSGCVGANRRKVANERVVQGKT